MNLEELNIRLVKDTIDWNDIQRLISWLQKNPRLTKGYVTEEFEKSWSNFQGRKYSVFVNSGSSANLAMLYALKISDRLKNQKIVVPTISWVTTVSPTMQLGMEPILCDADRSTLGVDVEHLEKIFREENPAALMIVNVLGFPNKMREIQDLCSKYGVILLEDSCESVGSRYSDGTLTGNFGLMSTFSTYFGHHFSTIEGGLIVTDDEELYHLLLSIRSHGWDRDLPADKQKELREKYSASEFRALYNFYYPGFNLRSTDLQAYIGLGQLDKLQETIVTRERNYQKYHSEIKNRYWKINPGKDDYISNFAYPIVHPDVEKIAEDLFSNGVEVRPLVCGSISEQPFWLDEYGYQEMKFGSVVHEEGMYLPNHQHMEDEEIELVCKIVNKYTE